MISEKPRSTILLAGGVAALVLSTLATCQGCRGWPEANHDIRELRAIHRAYRAEVTPKDPTHTADVDSLAGKIEDVFDKMDKLTQ